MLQLPGSLSKTLRAVSVVAAFLVVCVHYKTSHHPLEEFFANGLARVATPVFALIAGLFVFLKLRDGASYLKNVKDRVQTVLIPYLCASTLIFLWALARDYWLNRQTPLDANLVSFFYRAILTPSSLQLWFLRDLMILVGLSGLFLWVRADWVRKVGVLALMVCWLLEYQFMPKMGEYYFLNLNTLVFFSLGWWLAQNTAWLERVSQMRLAPLLLLTALWCLLNLIRVVVCPEFDLWYTRQFNALGLLCYKLGILCGIVVLFVGCHRLKIPIIERASKYTFFVFLFHLQPLQAAVFRATLPLKGHPLHFYAMALMAFVTALTIAYMTSRVSPKLYALLTGARAQKIKIAAVQRPDFRHTQEPSVAIR